MRKIKRSIIAISLCFLMILGTVAIGGNGFAEVLESLSVKASAYDYTLIYSISNNSITITGLSDSSYSGNLVIPETIEDLPVTAIKSYAFKDCSSITSVTIPASIKDVEIWAFDGCTGLTKTYYDGDISDWCEINFAHAESNPVKYSGSLYIDGKQVTDLIIPDGTESICAYAFYGCTSINSVTIPASVKEIGIWAFCGCTGLTKTSYEGNVDGWCKINFSHADSNPIKYSHNLFIDGNQLTNLIIPDGTESIGAYAFSGCTSVASVTISNSVKNIGIWAFDGCSGLTKTSYKGNIAGWCRINFAHAQSNPVKYSGNLYIDDKQITDLIIPDSTESIGAYAFSNCTSIESVTIPVSVKDIGIWAFDDCTGISKTYYKGNITEWCKISFAHAQSNPVKYSGNLYIDDKQITDLIIPEGTESICAYAFTNCTSVTSVTIPDSIKNIGIWAFDGCTGLTKVYCKDLSSWCSINFSHSNSNPLYYAHGFYDENGLIANIVIPEGADSISPYCFYNCSSMKTISIPSTVKSIGIWAFYGCSLLSDVFYSSSVSNYGNIEIASSGNDNYANAVKHFGLSVNLISNGNLISSGSYQSGDTFTFPADPTRTGYKFNGWNTSADGTGTTYNAGEGITITEAITFYAQWECLHQLGLETERVEPTCTEEGNTGNTVCKECGAILSTGEVIKAKGHTASAAIKENIVAASCVIDGSYDEVVYCADCGAEMSREKITVPAAGHTIGITVKENEITPTCVNAGTYDNITYCSKCGAELKTETVVVKALGHTDADNNGYCDICGIMTDVNLANPCRNAKINIASTRSVDYKSDVTITATAENVPEGYHLELIYNGMFGAEGTNKEVTYHAGKITGNVSYIVQVVDAKGYVQQDKDGNDLKVTGQINCNANFFTKIIAFFKSLFGSLPTVTIKP